MLDRGLIWCLLAAIGGACMVHSRAPDKLVRRRERAIRCGYLCPRPPGHQRWLAVPEPQVDRVRLMSGALDVHDLYDHTSGTHHHDGWKAARDAKALLPPRSFAECERKRKAGNAAKHSGCPAQKRLVWADAVSSDSEADDPWGNGKDPWSMALHSPSLPSGSAGAQLELNPSEPSDGTTALDREDLSLDDAPSHPLEVSRSLWPDALPFEPSRHERGLPSPPAGGADWSGTAALLELVNAQNTTISFLVRQLENLCAAQATVHPPPATVAPSEPVPEQTFEPRVGDVDLRLATLEAQSTGLQRVLCELDDLINAVSKRCEASLGTVLTDCRDARADSLAAAELRMEHKGLELASRLESELHRWQGASRAALASATDRLLGRLEPTMLGIARSVINFSAIDCKDAVLQPQTDQQQQRQQQQQHIDLAKRVLEDAGLDDSDVDSMYSFADF
mmetsp:Transcript_66665/g.194951  ORF Transcript_66665/g.194951 Transcript_66665/m.194951 type:complete len:450 (+) Transcript_66665:72-1421(+)